MSRSEPWTPARAATASGASRWWRSAVEEVKGTRGIDGCGKKVVGRERADAGATATVEEELGGARSAILHFSHRGGFNPDSPSGTRTTWCNMGSGYFGQSTTRKEDQITTGSDRPPMFPSAAAESAAARKPSRAIGVLRRCCGEALTLPVGRQ